MVTKNLPGGFAPDPSLSHSLKYLDQSPGYVKVSKGEVTSNTKEFYREQADPTQNSG